MPNTIDKHTQIRFHKMALECQSFYNASQILWEDHKEEDDDFRKVFPCIVNCAFTCELALKAILLKTNTSYGRTHYLYTLLCKVPFGFIDVVLEALHMCYYPDRDKEMLSYNIKAVSDIFYKLRYVADFSVTFEIDFVKNLTDILFYFEQKLCGQIEIHKGAQLTNEKEIEEVDQKLTKTYSEQIVDAEKDLLKSIKVHKRRDL